MQLKFKVEQVREIRGELAPLLELHYQEIAHFKDIRLEPDWDRYFAMEEAGSFVAFTVREDERLVGYAAYFLAQNAHYKSSKQAAQDVIFIHPEKRGAGREFIAWCDRRLREMGVQLVAHHVKAAHNWGPKVLEPMGYELVDLIYARRLD